MRPVRAKALIINAFALTGRIAVFNPYTQGAALGYELLPPSGRAVLAFEYLLLLNYLFLLVVKLILNGQFADRYLTIDGGIERDNGF